MFKVICKISKKTQISLKFHDCIPCKFNNYNIFGYNIDPIWQKDSALQIAEEVENLNIDISNNKYKYLHDRTYYLDELQNYLYILLFDLIPTPLNDLIKFLQPHPIYSAIIKNIHSDSNWDNYFPSWFSVLVANQNENFITMNEVIYSFNLPTNFNDQPYKGILNKVLTHNNQIKYSIDSYFLMYLLFDQQISKCSTLDYMPIPKEAFYEQYKYNLPKLHALQYLDIINKVRICASDDQFIMLENDMPQFIIDLGKNRPEDHFEVHILYAMCESRGGELRTIFDVVQNTIDACKNDSKGSYTGFFSTIPKNDLYNLNCTNFEHAINMVDNIEDIYVF